MWSEYFQVGLSGGHRHQYASSVTADIIILISPLKLYALYLLGEILLSAVLPPLLSYLPSYTPPSSSFQTSLSPCSHLVLYPSPPLLCLLAFTETQPLPLSAMHAVPNIGRPSTCVSMWMCAVLLMSLVMAHIPMGLCSALWLNIAWLCLHTSLQDCDKRAEHSEQMSERCWHPSLVSHLHQFRQTCLP